MVGQTLAHYRILEKIGAGGMGDVYKARDTRLDRLVAIKVLSKDLPADSERLKRFAQEAQTASALDHPNIVTIHDIAEVYGQHFIVMQYVDGKTLREMMAGNRLPLSKVLHYAYQIADALARAHSHGIVHRDFKPDNVIVTNDDVVKILDFGLAKLIEPSDLSEASTRGMERPRTKEGHIVGTAPYMSPEQAHGQNVDARSDVFSFGSVLYEMVTGRRAFTAGSIPELLTAIIREEPKRVSVLVPAVPLDLEKVISRAMRKEPERRFQSVADMRVELLEIKEELDSGSFVSADQVSTAIARGSGTTRRWLATAVVAIGLVVAGWLVVSRSERLPPPRTIPITSYPGEEWDPALSPDGDLVAFTRRGEAGTRDLYVKQIAGGEPLALSSGLGDVFTPTWSPDGQRIAFIRHIDADEGVQDSVFVIPALGGAEQQIAVFRGPHGLSWSPDGSLLAFPHQDTPESASSIYLLSVETGEKRKITAPPVHEIRGDSAPRFSPDGETLAFERGGATESDIYLVSVEGEDERRLTFGNHTTRGLDWAPDGKSIVFSAGRPGRVGYWSLWRVAASGGKPEPLEVGEQGESPTVSKEGTRLAYARRDANWNVWRAPGPSAGPETRPPERFITSTGLDYMPRYSPDGTRILLASSRSGYLEIWVCDSDGTNPRQLTFFEHPVTLNGQWSPDGQQIAFMSNKEGSLDIYIVGASGGVARRLTMETWNATSPHWSRDGRSIYFGSNRTETTEVWKIPAEGGEAIRITENLGSIAFESPDGAYLFLAKQNPDGGAPGIWRMPIDGGEEELILEDVRWGDWAPTERGIFYFDRGVEPGTAVELFDFATGEVSPVTTLEHSPLGIWPSVSPDGQWILYARSEEESDIMLVENFR